MIWILGISTLFVDVRRHLMSDAKGEVAAFVEQ